MKTQKMKRCRLRKAENGSRREKNGWHDGEKPTADDPEANVLKENMKDQQLAKREDHHSVLDLTVVPVSSTSNCVSAETLDNNGSPLQENDVTSENTAEALKHLKKSLQNETETSSRRPLSE